MCSTTVSLFIFGTQVESGTASLAFIYNVNITENGFFSESVDTFPGKKCILFKYGGVLIYFLTLLV